MHSFRPIIYLPSIIHHWVVLSHGGLLRSLWPTTSFHLSCSGWGRHNHDLLFRSAVRGEYHRTSAHLAAANMQTVFDNAVQYLVKVFLLHRAFSFLKTHTTECFYDLRIYQDTIISLLWESLLNETFHTYGFSSFLQNDKTSHACLIICCTQNMHLPVCPQLPAPHITEAAPILLDVIINQRRVTTSDIIHNRGHTTPQLQAVSSTMMVVQAWPIKLETKISRHY